MPPIPKVDNDTLVMIIEQLLMLLLIIGRWMLPKVRRKQEINPESRLMLVLLYRAAWLEMNWRSCCSATLEQPRTSSSSSTRSRIPRWTLTRSCVSQCCASGTGLWCSSPSSSQQHRCHSYKSTECLVKSCPFSNLYRTPCISQSVI